MKLRNTEFSGVCFMKKVGKEGVVKTYVKHSTMKEDIGTTRKQKPVLRDCCLEPIQNNFSYTLLLISTRRDVKFQLFTHSLIYQNSKVLPEVVET